MNVITVQSEEHFKQLIQNGTSVVDFTASWCGPCAGIAPYFKQLAQGNQEIKFLKVDVDELGELSLAANVRTLPTFVVYKNGIMTSERAQGADTLGLAKIVQNSKYHANMLVPNAGYQVPNVYQNPGSHITTFISWHQNKYFCDNR